MDADFYNAHKRHLQDAEQLFSMSRYANADHLYGIAAECGLKRLMVAFSMPVDGSGAPTDRKDRVHANKVWTRYSIYSQGPVAANYVLNLSNPFLDWNIDQRYSSEANFDSRRVAPHKLGAMTVNGLLRKAKLQGLI